VVDDHGPVRNMLRAVLEWHGFRVLTAADGEEAVALYPEHAAEIAVVLLDVRMPGMDGPRTLDALRRVNPDVVACFMSGDLGDYELADLFGRGARHVFEKPFNLDELARALRALVPGDPRAGR
jgi:CheY-like chemotaxis protein